jgi:cell division protein YceG involved in septum cleavage
VVKKMLDQFGENLCPGPANDPTAYLNDAAKCRQNAVTIPTTNGKNIFDLMRAAYPTATSDIQALRDATTIASLATREIIHYPDAVGVAAVYHNHYLHDYDANKYPSDVGENYGSDPSVEYARDNEKPPSNGKWWQPLNGDGNKIAADSPYNLYANMNGASSGTPPYGMPPGPIANPTWAVMQTGINPAKSSNWYFVSNGCGKILYATDSAGFAQIENQMNSTTGC